MSVYFNLRNILLKSGTFPLGHLVYIYIYIPLATLQKTSFVALRCVSCVQLEDGSKKPKHVAQYWNKVVLDSILLHYLIMSLYYLCTVLLDCMHLGHAHIRAVQ